MIKVNVLPSRIRARAEIASRLSSLNARRHSPAISFAVKLGMVPRENIKPLGDHLLNAMITKFYGMKIGPLMYVHPRADEFAKEDREDIHQNIARFGLLEGFSSVAFSFAPESRASFYFIIHTLLSISSPDMREPTAKGTISFLSGMVPEERSRAVEKVDAGLPHYIRMFCCAKKPFGKGSELFGFLESTGIRIKPPLDPASIKAKETHSPQNVLNKAFSRPALPAGEVPRRLALPPSREMAQVPSLERREDLEFLLWGVVWPDCDKKARAARRAKNRKDAQTLSDFQKELESVMAQIALWNRLVPRPFGTPALIPGHLLSHIERLLDRAEDMGLL